MRLDYKSRWLWKIVTLIFRCLYLHQALFLENKVKTMSDHHTQYDNIGSKYEEYSHTATAKRAERYSVFRMVGTLDGQRVLDFACGLGFYTRLLKQQGAGQVIGVDISPEMIRIASQHEKAEPLGIAYHVCNALELPNLGSFDLITAIWLLNYAKTKDELLDMFRMAYDSLYEDGRFVAYTINPAFDLRKSNFTKYGVTFTSQTRAEDRVILEGEFVVDPSNTVTVSGWSQHIYEWGILEAGFREFAWHPAVVSPEDVELYGQEYWQDFHNNSNGIGLICKK